MKSIFQCLVLGSFILICQSAAAQKTSAPKEVGLQFSGINFGGSNDFNLLLKKQLKEHVYRRLRFFYGNLSTASQNDETRFSFSTGISIGKEKRKSMGEKLQFFQGPEFAPSVDFLLENESVYLGANFRFGWVLGLQHDFNEHWAVNIEMVPGARLSFNSFDDDSISAIFNASLNNTVSLAVMRKF